MSGVFLFSDHVRPSLPCTYPSWGGRPTPFESAPVRDTHETFADLYLKFREYSILKPAVNTNTGPVIIKTMDAI